MAKLGRVGTGSSEAKISSAAYNAALRGTLDVCYTADGQEHITVGGRIVEALDNFVNMIGSIAEAWSALKDPSGYKRGAGPCYSPKADKAISNWEDHRYDGWSG